MKVPAIAQRSSFWSAAFAIWFLVLWQLSSNPLPGPRLESDFPIDKILHFGYFFGGGGLLSAALFLKKSRPLTGSSLHLAVVLTLFLTGALDEWHQSWDPHRSGNDAGDLTFDILGALAGTVVFRRLQPAIFPRPTL
ncbi:VanZ family protein [Roseibacillus ishigakijimensis]|uniref:VanZ family protein n=1 Tax=Roseibacillus ishigakijimensis TaxID=454146 RepID=A0A934RP08_9BACT|nr:VanZ family protein [Roseibacillus ishigakijimensis]MBK1832843.1 VanZ family protein [Roseibacillus ishigakijimensis]